jgi:hypothetical protein
VQLYDKLNWSDIMKTRLTAVAAYLSKSGARTGLIAAGVLVVAGITVTGLNGKPSASIDTPDQTAEVKSATTALKSNDTQTKPEQPAAQPQPAASTAPSPAPTPGAVKPATTPAPAAKPVAPDPKKPTSGIATPGPNAIKYVVHSGATISYEPNTGPIRLRYSYSIVRDGSYTLPVTVGTTFQSGPGASNALFCTSGGSGGDNGTTEIIVNYNAPVGIYTCGIGGDIGYTRYETRFRVERTETSLTILPGNEVIPGRPI